MLEELCWCICGDLNSIRSEQEHKGDKRTSREEEMICFNEFIDNAQMVGLLLIGRKFMWSRLDGACMSRLDHFLLSEKWCEDVVSSMGFN